MNGAPGDVNSWLVAVMRIPGPSARWFRFDPPTRTDLIRPGIPGHPPTP